MSGFCYDLHTFVAKHCDLCSGSVQNAALLITILTKGHCRGGGFIQVLLVFVCVFVCVNVWNTNEEFYRQNKICIIHLTKMLQQEFVLTVRKYFLLYMSHLTVLFGFTLGIGSGLVSFLYFFIHCEIL